MLSSFCFRVFYTTLVFKLEFVLLGVGLVGSEILLFHCIGVFIKVISRQALEVCFSFGFFLLVPYFVQRFSRELLYDSSSKIDLKESEEKGQGKITQHWGL